MRPACGEVPLFSARLAAERAARDYSLAEVAARLGELSREVDGTAHAPTVRTVWGWEREGRRPAPRYRRLLCRLYERTPEQLGFVVVPNLLVVNHRALPRELPPAAAHLTTSSELAPLIGALLSHGATEAHPAPAEPVNVAAMRRSVASSKRAYQACRYAAASGELRPLLSALRYAEATVDRDDLSAVHELSAAAHHVAASLLLKRGDAALACVAADRSATAARRSGDPLAAGCSARILSRALLAAGHAEQAAATVEVAAAGLEARRTATPARLSVLGSLLLHAAIVAARRGDRARTIELLADADSAARSVGGDRNYRWTAFGPINVALHRVDAAVTLGDAGSAIEHAQTVDPARVPVVERLVSLQLGMASAFAQWRKFDWAIDMLHAAERTAPEEIRARPRVHSLVRELLPQAGATTQPSLRALGERIGAIA